MTRYDTTPPANTDDDGYSSGALLWWNRGYAATLSGGLFNLTNVVWLGDSLTELGHFARVSSTVYTAATGLGYPLSSGWRAVDGLNPWAGPAGTTILNTGRNGYRRRVTVGQTASFNVAGVCGGVEFSWRPGDNVECKVAGVVVHTGTSGSYVHSVAGPYLLEMTAVGGSADLEGAMVYPGLSGPIVHTWGHTGWAAADFLATPDTFTKMATLTPSLVFIQLGINEDQANGGYRRDIEALILRIRATVPNNCNIGLWVPYEGLTNRPGTIIQSDARALARRYGCKVVDAYQAGMPNAWQDPLISADGVHPTTPYGITLANQVAAALVGDNLRT